MLKRKSSDALVKLTHDESSLETIELQDKINILESMIDKPSKMNRRVYLASKLYDTKGNLNTDHIGYQLAGTLALTNIPISIILGTGIIGTMTNRIDLPNGLLITAGAYIIGEAITFTGIGAYTTSKGSKMATEIRNKLAIDLEKNGYQVSLPEEQHKMDFDALIISLVSKISLNQYPNYEVDHEKVRQLYSRWLNIKAESLANRGIKPQVPQEILTEYHSLYNEIHHKIKMFRYEDNNSKLLTQDKIGGLSTNHIKLMEEDSHILEISNLIKQILDSNYEGFANDIESLRSIATEWISANIKSYRDNGYKLDSNLFPQDKLNIIKERILPYIEQKTLSKKH